MDEKEIRTLNDPVACLYSALMKIFAFVNSESLVDREQEVGRMWFSILLEAA